MREEKVFIPSGTIQLEGLLIFQEVLPVKGGVILCHPHPQYGGDMHNPVIKTAMDAASQEGFSTLRFNFRGVGESEGSYGNGIGEMEDVKAAIDYLCTKQNDSCGTLILVGYSFGAWIGLSVGAQDSRVKGMVAIAPPLETLDLRFLKGCKKRKLIIAGSQDFVCPSALLDEWYEQLEEPKSLAIIQDADHFFFGHTRALFDPLRAFFKVIPQHQL
jgi:alpha/beta superfamily hydrolase